MPYIESFTYLAKDNPIFNDKMFKDPSPLKQYIRQSNAKSKSNPYFEQIIGVLDSFYELRTYAEAINKKGNYFKVFNKDKELPVSWDEITEVLNPNNGKISDEPPTRLINIIAKQKFGTIQTLSDQMRKLLQRKREMVPLSRIQQIDSTCIRWLTKQPGYTTEQKAGNKQRLLGVVRYETYDTLENRVFKDFLRLCIVECRSYIEKYKVQYASSQRIKEVRKLQNLAVSTLAKPEMQNVKKIYNTPKPNYVLQNNASYKTIWDLYKKLLHKSKLLEAAWSNRQVMMSQYLQVCSLDYFRNLKLKINSEDHYYSVPTINLVPSKEGVFMNNLAKSEKLIYLKSLDRFIEISPLDSSCMMKINIQYSYYKKDEYFLKFMFLPDVEKIESQEYRVGNVLKNNTINIVYKETPEIKIKRNKMDYLINIIEIQNTDDIYKTIADGLDKIFSSIYR